MSEKLTAEQLFSEFVALKEENERLRKALEKIIKLGAGIPDHTAEIGIAREALHSQGGEE